MKYDVLSQFERGLKVAAARVVGALTKTPPASASPDSQPPVQPVIAPGEPAPAVPQEAPGATVSGVSPLPVAIPAQTSAELPIVTEPTVVPEVPAEDTIPGEFIPPTNEGVQDMADENLSSKEGVAFKLMQHVAALENKPDDTKNDRSYWFGLYRQCLKVVNGQAPKRRKKAAAPAAAE